MHRSLDLTSHPVIAILLWHPVKITSALGIVSVPSPGVEGGQPGLTAGETVHQEWLQELLGLRWSWTRRSEQSEKAEKTQLSGILEKGVGRDEVPEEVM